MFGSMAFLRRFSAAALMLLVASLLISSQASAASTPFSARVEVDLHDAGYNYTGWLYGVEMVGYSTTGGVVWTCKADPSDFYVNGGFVAMDCNGSDVDSGVAIIELTSDYLDETYYPAQGGTNTFNLNDTMGSYQGFMKVDISDGEPLF